jgi:hypothetical protein
MEPLMNAFEQTKKQLRSLEVHVLVRVDATLRAIDGRVRGRLRKLGHGRKPRQAVRKAGRRRHANGAVAAAA